MHFVEINGRRYARFERFAAISNLKHAFSTRGWDVSARTDAMAEVRAARRADMARDLGLDPARLTWCVQVHEPHVFPVTPDNCGEALEGVDAVFTNEPGVPLMTFSADCPLICVVDPAAPGLGLAHASWRCTVARIVERLIERMSRELDARPERMRVGIGPSAGPAQYEVGDDVRAAAAHLPDCAALFPINHRGRRCFDLWRANRDQLIRAGVAPEHIEIAGICTMADTERFYSFRREGPGCGHFGLMAALV